MDYGTITQILAQVEAVREIARKKCLHLSTSVDTFTLGDLRHAAGHLEALDRMAAYLQGLLKDDNE